MTDNYGIIRVTLLSQDVYRDYVIRKLEVSEERAKSSAVRELHLLYNIIQPYIMYMQY